MQLFSKLESCYKAAYGWGPRRKTHELLEGFVIGLIMAFKILWAPNSFTCLHIRQITLSAPEAPQSTRSIFPEAFIYPQPYGISFHLTSTLNWQAVQPNRYIKRTVVALMTEWNSCDTHKVPLVAMQPAAFYMLSLLTRQTIEMEWLKYNAFNSCHIRGRHKMFLRATVGLAGCILRTPVLIQSLKSKEWALYQPTSRPWWNIMLRQDPSDLLSARSPLLPQVLTKPFLETIPYLSIKWWNGFQAKIRTWQEKHFYFCMLFSLF